MTSNGEESVLKRVMLFTDGSCLGNPGPGGWACILRYKDRELGLRGGEIKTTSNRMELVAAIRGLRSLKERCKVVAVTDSQYLRRGMTQYLAGWQRRGWINSRGEAVANRGLWEELAAAASEHEIEWRWVRGHGSDADQNRCDTLALGAARAAASGRLPELAA